MDSNSVQTTEVGNKKVSNIRSIILLIILMSLASAILLPSLGKGPFWQDEAENALLAKSIIAQGLPTVWNGKNIVTQLNGNESTPDCLWTFTPWLPFYITAASFKLFGESNFAGRLPFVLIAILSIIPAYLLALRLTASQKTSFLAVLLFILNMQFILYSRQSKYYSLFFLLSPILLLTLIDLTKNWLKSAIFTMAATLLFYTNYVALFTLFCGMGIYTLFFSRDKKLIKRFFVTCFFIFCLTVPFFIFANVGTAAAGVTSYPTPKAFFDKLGRIVWHFNNMVFPLVLFIPLFFTKTWRPAIKLLTCIVFTAWLALPLLNQDVFRYNLGLIPLLFILMAIVVVAAWRRKKALGAILLITVLTTNVLSFFPWTITKLIIKESGFKFMSLTSSAVDKFGKKKEKTEDYFRKLDYEIEHLTLASLLTHDILKIEYLAYYNQLTKPYNEPMDAIISYLNKNAKPEDVVAVNFGQLPLEYYTSYKVGNIVDKNKLKTPKTFAMPEYIYGLEEVDWFITRSVSTPQGPFVSEQDLLSYLNEKGLKYETYDTGINVIYWDSTWPQHFKQYKNKFYFHENITDETVKIYHIFHTQKS